MTGAYLSETKILRSYMNSTYTSTDIHIHLKANNNKYNNYPVIFFRLVQVYLCFFSLNNKSKKIKKKNFIANKWLRLSPKYKIMYKNARMIFQVGVNTKKTIGEL